jgi:hypothetical protein
MKNEEIQDKFSQMKKNTVDSKNQLKESDLVRYRHLQNNGVKICFIGNSITLHSLCPSIGWNLECGMAASSVNNDYVSLTEQAVLKKNKDASFCICQVSGWESNYKNGSSKFHLYESARDFEADILVIRFIENCSGIDFDPKIFRNELEKLIKFLNKNGKAKIIVTTSFWHHPGDDELRSYAKDNSFPLIELGDLGEDDKMKAIGLFEHNGVANHPGDLGMKAISDRILEKILPLV